ncbi:FKBP-type peptidyl-prolyl cis-trans isomerase [Geomonas sp. Red32]|uniref:FKBP-type peptidyl-prolyl cis-trans isomerase n=1 Tax=Geomonas sp. Red32 TaxID=2912856 RepID=UPI00202CCC55|nr:FKBP-type peptidyl-prolyl cis-trans isomerase [Geomonas sp. Red32]MCM0083907.1 FKBP-type peptidyl-prolyl cis-trans isomerase [Geomonas sp. Red32]
MPQIKYGSTALVHYSVPLRNGKSVESTAGGGPVRITVGAGKVIRGLEEALEGMSPGETRRVTIPPEKGYGRRKGEVAHHSFDTTAPVGKAPGELQRQVVNTSSPDGFSVVVTDKGVKVDSNPHLAGQDLVLDIEVIEIENT